MRSNPSTFHLLWHERLMQWFLDFSKVYALLPLKNRGLNRFYLHETTLKALSGVDGDAFGRFLRLVHLCSYMRFDPFPQLRGIFKVEPYAQRSPGYANVVLAHRYKNGNRLRSVVCFVPAPAVCPSSMHYNRLEPNYTPAHSKRRSWTNDADQAALIHIYVNDFCLNPPVRPSPTLLLLLLPQRMT